jgi:hypothetical protein
VLCRQKDKKQFFQKKKKRQKTFNVWDESTSFARLLVRLEGGRPHTVARVGDDESGVGKLLWRTVPTMCFDTFLKNSPGLNPQPGKTPKSLTLLDHRSDEFQVPRGSALA